MTEFANMLMQGIGVFFLIYLLLYASFLFFSVAAGAFRMYQNNRMAQGRIEKKHKYYLPVSLLVPAYNEEVTIVDSVRSLLDLNYRRYEVIVIDDGSRDNTADELIKAFNMRLRRRPIHQRLKCQPAKAIYETQTGKIKLTLICKANGGKGDALNMGINASQYPYFICVDADSMLQADSLEKIFQPVLEDDSVVAVGGMVRVAQHVEMDKGKVKSYRLPRNPTECMQVIEYDRSFMASRIFMDHYNGNLIVSGTFGLFKKDVVVAAGGYDSETLGEDMELVVRLHVFCRNNKQNYSIRYTPNAVCWSQAPTSLRDLCKQRRRWHLGLLQSMFFHRRIFGNLRFGLVSWVSYMYYLLFEVLSPFVEVFGMLSLVVASALGLLNFSFMIWYLLLYTVYGTILSVTAFCQRIYSQQLKITALDTVRAVLMCFLESGFYRYILSFVRITSLIGYKKRKNQWGVIKRVKHSG